MRGERRIGSAEQLSCYLDGVERHLRLVAYHKKLARPETSERHPFSWLNISSSKLTTLEKGTRNPTMHS